MDRILQQVIRAAVHQLTRQGISGAINYISKRAAYGKNADSFEARDERREQEKDESLQGVDQGEIRKRMRTTRGRF